MDIWLRTQDHAQHKFDKASPPDASKKKNANCDWTGQETKNRAGSVDPSLLAHVSEWAANGTTLAGVPCEGCCRDTAHLELETSEQWALPL